MNEIRPEPGRTFREVLAEVLPDDRAELRDGEFADELAELALDHVFTAYWGRPALDPRARSLVTLGALIALRANHQLEFHFPMALRNGLTIDELAEVVYHSAGYAGFPAAVNAQAVARKVLGSPAAQPDS